MELSGSDSISIGGWGCGSYDVREVQRGHCEERTIGRSGSMMIMSSAEKLSFSRLAFHGARSPGYSPRVESGGFNEASRCGGLAYTSPTLSMLEGNHSDNDSLFSKSSFKGGTLRAG